MPMVVDTHVHIYPVYELGAFVVDTAARLRALVPGAVPVLCLTERAGEHLFTALTGQPVLPGTDLPLQTIEGPGGVGLCVRDPAGPLYLLPGRQVATSERLEVLAIGRDLELADGVPAGDVIEAILAAGGLPVLTWAFGKWWFRRAPIVQALIEQFAPEQLWIGDTTMRPREWPRGGIMRRAIADGARILAGGDPLPSAGEATRAGRYATLLSESLDERDPAGSIIQALRALPPGGRTVGARSILPSVLIRQVRHRGPVGR
ncbi:MAG: hypothetical protein HN700_03735 [Verrucomicrobia bacterium]|nr:hypothetical protein [Verrucomicrobiota bacterium]